MKGVESRPQLGAGSTARDESTGGVLGRRTGAKSDPKGRQEPLVVRDRTTDDATQHCPNVFFSCTKAGELKIRRRRATRVEDLGPSGTGPEKAKSPARIWETADGSQQTTSFGNSPAQKVFAQIDWSEGSTMRLKTGGPVPTAPWEIGGAERLGGGARVNDLGLVEIDLEPNAFEPVHQTRGSSAENEQWSMVRGLDDPTGLLDDRVGTVWGGEDLPVGHPSHWR